MKPHLIWWAAVSLIGLLVLSPAWSQQDAGKLRQALFNEKEPGKQAVYAGRLLEKYPDVVKEILKSEARKDVIEAVLANLDKKPDFLGPLFRLYERMQPDGRIRQKVIGTLETLDSSKVEAHLIGIANNGIQPDGSRHAAIRGLGELKAYQKIGELLGIYKKEKTKFGKSILNSLTEMTRLSYGADVGAWETLWGDIRGKPTTTVLSVFLERLHALRLKDLESDTQEIKKLIDPKNLKQNLLAMQGRLPGVREYAIANLTALGDKQVAQAFLKLLPHEKDVKVLAALLTGIGQLGVTQAGPLLLQVAERVRTANNPHPFSIEEKRTLYARIAVALGKIRFAKSVTQLEKWLFWSQANPTLKMASIEALGSIGGPLAYKPLATILATGKVQTKVLETAAEALGGFRQASGILIKALASTHTEVRAAAANSLDKIAPMLKARQRKAVAAALTTRLTAASQVEREPRVRSLMIVALGKYPDTHKTLANLLVTEKDSLCRLSAAEALVKHGWNDQTLSSLIKALEDKDTQVRAAAFKGLRTLAPGTKLKELAGAWFDAGKYSSYCLTIFAQRLAELNQKPTPQTAPQREALAKRVARCHYRLGQLPQARPLYDKHFAQSSDQQVLYEFANILSSTKIPEDQQQALTRLSTIPPPAKKDVPHLHWQVALLREQLSASLSKPEVVLASIEKLGTIDPGFGGLKKAFVKLEKVLRAKLKQPPKKPEKKTPRKQPGDAGKGAGAKQQGK